MGNMRETHNVFLRSSFQKHPLCFCGENPLEITKCVYKWVFQGKTAAGTGSACLLDVLPTWFQRTDTLQPGPLTRTEPPMKPSNLPTKLRVSLWLHPVQPPLTLFDFRLRSGAQNTNMLRPLETLFWWILTLVGKCSHFHSLVTDVERQDTKPPTVLPDSTSESWV